MSRRRAPGVLEFGDSPWAFINTSKKPWKRHWVGPAPACWICGHPPGADKQDPFTVKLRELIADVVRAEASDKRTPSDTQRSGYMSTSDAAAYAVVASGTIRRWIRDGRLPAHHAGRELRVRRADLDLLMRRGRQRRERSPEEIAEDFIRRKIR